MKTLADLKNEYLQSLYDLKQELVDEQNYTSRANSKWDVLEREYRDVCNEIDRCSDEDEES